MAPLGVVLGPFCAPWARLFEDFLGHRTDFFFYALFLARSRAILKHLGPRWGHLRAILGHLGAILGHQKKKRACGPALSFFTSLTEGV